VCFIFFIQAGVSELLKDQMKSLLDIFKKDPVTLVWVDKYDETELHKQFDGSKYHLVAYKPKRGRFLGYRNPDFSADSIRTFIDDVLGGGGDF